MSSNYINIAGNIIAPFPLESVTTKEFAWLPPNSWNVEDSKFWVNHRYSHPDSALQAPPFVLKKHQKIKFTRGAWLLRSSDTTSAWAEIHCFHSAFTKLCLFFDCVHPMSVEQLSLLVSAAIINSETDVLYLAPLSKAGREISNKLNAADSHGWWMPNSHLPHEDSPIGYTMEVARITPSTWWSLEQGQQDRATLSYLVKRKEFEKERQQRQQATEKRPRFRGLVGLFNPWRR